MNGFEWGKTSPAEAISFTCFIDYLELISPSKIVLFDSFTMR